MRVEPYVGFLDVGEQLDVESGSRDDFQLDFRLAEGSVLGLQDHLDLLGRAGFDRALVGHDLHRVFLELVLLGEVEVEVELPLVLDGERADLLHADVDLAVVELVSLAVGELEAVVGDDVLVQVEAGALDVYQDRLGLAFDVADQVLVEVGLRPGFEGDVDLLRRVGPDHAAHRRDVQAVLLARLALHALRREVERDRDVVFVEQRDLLDTLGIQQQRVEVDARHVEHHFRLDHFADQVELALDAHRADTEDPGRDVDASRFRGLRELHFVLLAGYDESSVVRALELVSINADWVLGLPFPVELVLFVSRVEHLESLHVLDLGADALDVDEVGTRRQLDLHVLQLLNQLAGVEFEVADRALAAALDEQAEWFRVLPLDVDVQLALAEVDLGGVEPQCDVDLAVGFDGARLVVGAEGLEAGVAFLVLHDHVVVDGDGLGVGEREVVGARGVHHGGLELDDLEVGLDLDLVAARVDHQLQVAHVVRQFDRGFGLDLFLRDVAGFVRVEGRFLLLHFRAFRSRRFRLAFHLLRLFSVLCFLLQPLVLAFANLPYINHRVIPILRHICDSDSRQLQHGRGQLHRFIRKELDFD